MRTRAAVIRESPGAFEVLDVELDDPRQGEIRVKMVAAGLCHSDDHIATGDVPVATYPFAGGHEGAGIVESVGPNTVGFEPGDKVVVIGIGGIGANAVQGASHAGAANVIAVDPVGYKLEVAESLGATHAVSDIDAGAVLARSLTNGQGADVAVVTVGAMTGDIVARAFSSIRKAGTVVVTGLGDVTAVGVPISLGELTLFQKQLKGAMYGGGSNPTADIPRLLGLYQTGHLKLDELITTRYTLDEINQGYEDMHAGKNIRGMISFS